MALPVDVVLYQDAHRIVADVAHNYNTLRVQSGIGTGAPRARLEGQDQPIVANGRIQLPAAPQASEITHGQPCQMEREHLAPVSVVA